MIRLPLAFVALVVLAGCGADGAPLAPQPKPAVTVGSTTIALTGDARMGVTGTIR
jgi:hypothetical protein